MMKSFKIALLLALMLPVVADVSAARPSSTSSFKSGFSSGKSSSASPSRSSSSKSGGFGSFGGRSSTPAPAPRTPDAAPARSGGFGAFGASAPRQDSSATPQKSDSALSQRLSKGDAQANAIRTYDERKAAEAARNAPPPVPAAPSYAGNGGAQPGYNGPQPSYGPAPAPIIINNGNGGSGFGNIVTGFLLGRAMSPSHAHAGSYPGTVAGTAPAGTVAAPPGGNSFFMSVLRTFAWLAIIALVGWGLYFGWKFLRRGSAPSRANYSFDRN